MANVNTDQKNSLLDSALIVAPTAGAITTFQRSVAVAQQRGAGNSNLEIPGQYKATSQKVKVRAYGNSKLATVASQALTVSINGVNAAGASVILATTGAVAAATQAGNIVGWYLEAEFLVNFGVVGTTSGEFQGNYANGLVARAPLSNQPNFSRSVISGTAFAQALDENQFFTVSITQAQTDATASHQLEQLSSEIL